MTTAAGPAVSRPEATVAEFGIGMRLSIHPHTDDFVEVILGALGDVAHLADAAGFVVETDPVSTYVGARRPGAEADLARYAAELTAAAHRRSGAGHVVTHVLLSRGCPGETTCDLSVVGTPTPVRADLPATGVPAVAQWSLYPLSDDGTSHMDLIHAAIAGARDVSVTTNHYATRLEADLADVVAVATNAWAQVGTQVPHVVTHLTISVGSPSPEG